MKISWFESQGALPALAFLGEIRVLGWKHTFNHALLESKISGTISFAQWWVLDLTLETL